MSARRRALASAGVACLVAIVVAGCGTAGSSSSSSTVTLPGRPLTIAISDPASLGSDPVARDVVDAERLAFEQHSGEVTDYKLALKLLRGRLPSDNARAAILYPSTKNPSVIAYIGEIAPGVSDQTAGITNALDLLEVSPTDTALELSQATPAVKGAPQSYFQAWSTYGRTFARVVPSSVDEAAAQVSEMKALGVSSLYVANDGSDYGKAISDAVAVGAHVAGIKLVNGVAGAGAVFYGAESSSAAAHFFNRTAAANASAKLFGPSALNSGEFTGALSASVRNLYVTIPGFMPAELPAAGRRFVSDFKHAYGHAPNVEAIFGYAAVASVLRVLKGEGKAADNRTSVVNAFLHQKHVAGVLGTYSIGGDGNTSLDRFVLARPRDGALVPFKAAPGT